MFLGGRTLSTIKIHMLIMEVSHFQESKLVYFLEVDHFLEIRGRTFSIVSHKHGHPECIVHTITTRDECLKTSN